MSPVVLWKMLLITRVLAGVAAAVACLGLLGYALDLPALISVRSGYRGMSPLTATGLLSLVVAIAGYSLNRERVARIGAIVAAVVVVLVFASHAFAGSDTISGPIAQALFHTPPSMIGRTSIATALGLLLISLSILTRRRHSALPDILAGLALVVAGTALLGYLYGVSDLYALPVFNTMAMHTAIGIACLALAAMGAEPGQGWSTIIASESIGGSATRRQLAFLALPVIAGWLLLKATNGADLGPAVAMALLVIFTVIPLALLVLRDGRQRDDLDAERQAHAQSQEEAGRVMEMRLVEQAQALSHESAERAKAETAMFHAQRMEAVGQLTGGIAHDFNNLLMAVRGNMELLGNRLPETDERARRYLNNAIAAADKGAKVTGQLLAFSRSQRLTIRAVELDPLLVGARELIGSSLGPDIEIVLDLQARGLWVETDPDQLELAILNLAVNARDAMPLGGKLRIESAGAEPLEVGDDMVDAVAIRVTDTGSGMTPEILAKAIEPFFTTKGQGKATGLGLAQVYGFVRQCRGDLRLTSEPGDGASIEIVLRAAEPTIIAVADVPWRLSRGDGGRNSRSVLVIDDDASVRNVIVDALRGEGFEVFEAADGKSGLALLERVEPAAAVIDFLMPGMNGAEVARLAQLRRPGLPIVFVSGYSDTVALDGIAGATVLRKPFDMAGLHRAVTAAIH